MDPDKRLSKTDMHTLIDQVCGVPQTRGLLGFVFEQLMAAEFNVVEEERAAVESLRIKLDELNETSTSDETLVFANSFADVINQIDKTNGLDSLADTTVKGCEFLANHLEVMITRDAPTLDLVDVKRAHCVLTAHVHRPRPSNSNSPTDRVAGTDRGFYRGQVAPAT